MTCEELIAMIADHRRNDKCLAGKSQRSLLALPAYHEAHPRLHGTTSMTDQIQNKDAQSTTAKQGLDVVGSGGVKIRREREQDGATGVKEGDRTRKRKKEIIFLGD